MYYPLYESDRFKAAPECPCGKSNKDGKFRPFLLNNRPAAAHGVCYSCGNTFLPDRETKVYKQIYSPVIVPKLPTKYIDRDIVQKSLRGYHNNNLALLLKKTFPERADYILQYFSIGTTRDGGTVFWYQDIGGNFRKPKVMYFKSDGHRLKNSPIESQNKPSPLWFTSKKGYDYCLFGEFQLARYPTTAKIVIVESEKSALIGHAHHPEYLWLATGGAVSFTKDKAKILTNRKAIIFPDMDEAGRNGARRTQCILAEIGCESFIQDLNESRFDGSDVADLLLQ